jgi:paraquat-inducible protein A
LNRHLIPQTVACPGCDLLQNLPPLPPGGAARCSRCGETLAARPATRLDHSLALALAAAVAFVVANAAPLMRLSAAGRESSTTIIGGAHQMWLHGQAITAVMVAFCVVIAPASYIVCIITVLLAARRPPAAHWVGELLRCADSARRWSMDDVMMLAILVALTKLVDLATVIPGVGMYAVGALVLLLAALVVSVDGRELWNRIEWADGGTWQTR